MNQVNITGMIVNEPVFREEAGGIPHTILSLRRRQKTRAGELRMETYRVSAWRGVSVWARDNVAVGQIVTIHGYLTQRKNREGAFVTEICAEEIVPSVQTAFKPGRADIVDNSVPVKPDPPVVADSASATDATNTADASRSDPGDAPEIPTSSGDGDTQAA